MSPVIETLEARELFSASLASSTSLTPSGTTVVSSTSTTTAIGFGKSTLTGTSSVNPTSLQFGPDGRLYVAQQDGLIKAYTIARSGANSYAATATENIIAVQSILNHDDDGTPNYSVTTRLVTGILVVGTAANPIVYVTSSDPRIGGGPDNTQTNADTNSGIISRLTWTGSSWSKLDLVRGLPRSAVDHATNGLQLNAATNTLYVAQAGNTNEGAPSNNFGYLPEYALSGAILKINLTAIGNTTYDLPTLDDENRPGTADANDPFGGDRGNNQAILVAGGPVQIYAPGFRNPYDLVLTSSGRLYAVDNGANAGWGNTPIGAGGSATNAVSEPGDGSQDQLQLITEGVYAGHPNPTRANMANVFNTSNPQSPVLVADPQEGNFLIPGQQDGALTTFADSTDGITEYTASNFGGAMQGDLLITSYGNQLYDIKLDATGTTVVSKVQLFSNVGSSPLDVTTQADGALFAGTIWVVDHTTNSIIVFEPNDYGGAVNAGGTGADDPTLDDDHDGYNNQDEIANNTNPESAADVPHDWDHDYVSDLLDADDDNDGKPDTNDPFAIDSNNGKTTYLPVSLSFGKEGSSPGGLLNLGFTGLMTNGTSNYASLFDPTKMTAGGAASVLTIDAVGPGDALGSLNTQQNAFQIGINTSNKTVPFTAHTRVLAPFAGLTPQAGQSIGFYIGTGDQDNYTKLVVTGTGTVQLVKEVAGVVTYGPAVSLSLTGIDSIDFYLTVNPATSMVQAAFAVTRGGVTGAMQNVGAAQAVPAAWLNNANSGLAVGLIATSGGAASFPATWGFLYVTHVNADAPYTGAPQSATTRIEAENFNSGGEGISYHDLSSENDGGALGYRDSGVDVENSGDTGGGYDVGWFQTGEWLDYTVNVSASGTYDIDFRIANKGAGGSFHLEEGGTNISGTIAAPDTGDWQTYTTVTKSGIQLSVGTHTFRLVADSENSLGFAGNVNWLQFQLDNPISPPVSPPVVSPPPASPPSPPPPPVVVVGPYGGVAAALPGLIEAEDFDTGGEGVSYHDLDTANSGNAAVRTGDGVDIDTTTDTGGGSNITSVMPGEWLNYTVKVAAGGAFDLNSRVASLGHGGSFHIEVDGIDVTGSMNVPNTGGGQNWYTLSKSGIILTAGQHTLRLVADALSTSADAAATVGNFNWISLTPPTTATVATQGDGLTATYFDDIDLTGASVTRVDPMVNLNLKKGAPIAGIAEGTYSVRWVGQLLAKYTEAHVFYTKGDDGMRLWIDNKLVINKWKGGGSGSSKKIALVAGQKYDIRVEYFQNKKAAVAQVLWSSKHQKKQVIPQAYLFSQPSIRVNAGGSEYTDSTGKVWAADSGFSNGAVSSSAAPVDGTASQPLFMSVRSGSTINFAAPVANGSYRLTLYFADAESTAAGQRTMNGWVNGQAVLSGFDPFANAGNGVAAETFIVAVRNGFVSVLLNGVAGNAIISAIEIQAM